jgi:hypothetical protein
MKFLILASPRSGSTTLTSLIGEHLKTDDYKIFYDPFNPNFYENYVLNGENFIDCEPFKKYPNLLVKSIIMENYVEYPERIFSKRSEYIDWCLEFFDKIIVLDRGNKKEQAESFVINETESRTRGIGWHTPKVYNIDKMDMNFFNKILNTFNETHDILLEISKENSLPYFLYENLYTKSSQKEIERLFEYLEINPISHLIDEFIHNKNRRVRIEPTVIKKLL